MVANRSNRDRRWPPVVVKRGSASVGIGFTGSWRRIYRGATRWPHGSMETSDTFNAGGGQTGIAKKPAGKRRALSSARQDCQVDKVALVVKARFIQGPSWNMLFLIFPRRRLRCCILDGWAEGNPGFRIRSTLEILFGGVSAAVGNLGDVKLLKFAARTPLSPLIDLGDCDSKASANDH